MPFILWLFIFLVTAISVSADAKSDFDFQYGKYRQVYFEYSLYKKDYLSTPTLDNQQKALLTAKQSITARDLTRASLAAYLRELISQSKLLGYQPMDELSSKLLVTQQHFLLESQKSQSLVTLADIDEFNTSYLASFDINQRYLKAGIVGHKLATLKNFAVRQQLSLEDLKERIKGEQVSARVHERVQNLEIELVAVHKKIDDMATYLITEESLENTQSEVFFTSRVELLAEIRTLQLSWMNQLIDLDTNYGKI